ncbi:hypothetical protein TNCV_72171, partial [Trichonephila clavipes]
QRQHPHIEIFETNTKFSRFRTPSPPQGVKRLSVIFNILSYGTIESFSDSHQGNYLNFKVTPLQVQLAPFIRKRPGEVARQE